MHRDALDLVRAFIGREVRFLLVGAHAVSYYSEPRTTGDLDIFIDPTAANAHNAYLALAEFGAPMLDLTEEDLATPGVIYQMGVPPYRIDIITQLTGVSFAESWQGRALAMIEGMEVPVISYPALVANKRATARPKDLIDLEMLITHRRADQR